MIPEALIEDAARRFAMLGDPSRLRVLRSLREAGEVSVGDLARRSNLTRTNVSQHLGRLALAGLVSRRREGTTVFYRIADASIDELCELVCTSLRAKARALAAS